MSNDDKMAAIVEQGGGCILRFDDVSRLATLIELAAYTEDEIEQGVADDPDCPFEVGVKTASKNVRSSFATLEEAIAEVVNTEGGTVDELADEFNFEVTEEHIGLTLEEIKAALGR